MSEPTDVIDDMEFFASESGKEKLRAFLKTKDPCFGKSYDKDETACNKCRMPVLLNGELFIMKEVCKSISKTGIAPLRVKRISSNKVLDRVQTGDTAEEIVVDIVQPDATYDEVAEARTVVATRLSYLKNQKNVPVPDLNSTKEIWESEFQ